jgi:hypothetical protein
MALRLRSWLLISALFVAVDSQLSPRISPSGVLAGVVVSADTAKTPIRRVSVTLSGSNIDNMLAVTGDDGKFAFRSLPPGRYTLSAARPGFITGSFGATRPGRSGTPIALAFGQQITNLSLRLIRGAVIAGTVLDERGEPARGLRVNALPVMTSSATGRRTLQPGPAAFVLAGMGGGEVSDDRGAYRIYGLAPGEYAIVATLPGQSAGIPETSETDFQRAVQLLKSPSAGTLVTPGRSNPARSLGPAPVFFPGTFTSAEARFISLGPAQEVTSIDFTVRPAPTARINGSIVGVDGRAMPGFAVRLISATGVPAMTLTGPSGVASDREGRFMIAGVTPGSYTLAVQPNSSSAGGPILWANNSVTIDGQDVEVPIVLRPAVRVSGTVAFESQGVLSPPSDSSRFRVALMAVPTEGEYVPNPAPAATGGDGAFVIAGVTSGRFRFQITPPSGTSARAAWFLKSITLHNRDVLDALLEVRAVDVAGIRITLTDRPIEVSGIIQDANGQPAPEYFLIAFPQNRALWISQSPRIHQVRPGTDGLYHFRGLLPGQYLVAAATDVQAGDLHDPAFLGQLVPTAVPIALKDGDKKVLNLQVK